MPPNIFALGQDAFKQSYGMQQAMREDRGRIRGGRALASGDRRGAMTALGGAGLTDDVRQVQQDQQRADAVEYGRAQDAEQQDYTRGQAEETKRAAFLKDIAQGLKGVPAGQRKQALDQVMPAFEQLHIDPGQFASLTEEQLTDQSLDIFSGEIDKHQLVNLGGGGAADFNPRSGDFKELRAPDKPIIVGNGASLIDPATGQPIYTNPKTFAPQRPRAAGGDGLPPGFVLD